MPSFAPGCHVVPRWRTRMLPPVTASPPNFFTPRRRPFESRPLRDEPPAFLCAIDQTPSPFVQKAKQHACLHYMIINLRRKASTRAQSAPVVVSPPEGLAPPVRRSVILTSVKSCRWPCLRFEFFRRRFLNAIVFGPRECSTISPPTLAPLTNGVPNAGSPS